MTLSQTAVGPLTLHTMSTRKYKTNTVVLKLREPLSADQIAVRALLPHVLENGTEQSPTFKALRRRLDELYGASLDVQLSKKGQDHIITFKMDIANEAYISEDMPLLQKALQLLSEVILQPYMPTEVLSEAIIRKEKQALIKRLRSERDDKMRYANRRLIEEMLQDDHYRLHPLGDEAGIDAVTPQALTAYYQHMLQTNIVDLYIIGDIDESRVRQDVQDIIVWPDNEADQASQDIQPVPRQHENIHEVVEEENLEQSKLHMGFVTHIAYTDHDYYALQVFNGLFGGFPHSKLFMNVREAESLAYYAASRVEGYKGLLYVVAGIASEDYDKTVAIIQKQLTDICEGEITDEAFEQTKIMLHNQLQEMTDSARGVIESDYNNKTSGRQRTMNDWLEGIEAVTVEDVIHIARQIELDTIYFLKGKETSHA